GSGTSYAAGATFTMAASDVTLYARWTANPTYKVLYLGNGSTGGSVPVDEGTYEAGDTVTVKGNTGNLSKTGHTFTVWNTASNGNGKAYAVGSTLIKNAKTDSLHAIWVIDSFTVSFDVQGGTSIDPLKVAYGSKITAPAEPSRTGYTFKGWYKEEDCTNTWNFATESVKGVTVLFAKWDINSYLLTYDGNGYSGGSVPAAVSRPYSSEVTVAAFGNLAKTGYTIVSWNTKKTSQETGVDYAPGDKFTMPAAAVTLYARWQIGEYVISYNLNGGSGTTPASQTVEYQETVALATAGNLQRAGYVFDGWNTNSGGTGTTYAAGSDYTMGAADLPLFAKWKELTTVTFDANGGSPSVQTRQAAQGNTVEQPSQPSFTACSFAGWYKEKECQNKWNFSSDIVNAAVTLYAKWIVKDVEDNEYDVVIIGDQVWMAENLRTTRYNDGSAISHLPDSASWDNMDTAGYCWYDNKISNKIPYGALYTGNVVFTGKLAPIGWHVPTSLEWDTLAEFLGGSDVAGGKMKETGTAHWNSPNTGATNSSGFTAVPAGSRSGKYFSLPAGVFANMGLHASWWVYTDWDDAYLQNYGISNDATTLTVSNLTKNYGRSVRCVRD
ncbi:MAG: InlB B-repeat-containing protein, partial [Chitinispirillaceae bacterium]|nr:InlB B-repeat-containing protein [Chitinispirillaceae bacterium]